MYNMTLNELIAKIKLRMDPYTLLEELDLEWEVLVDHLKDAIEEHAEYLEEFLDEEDSDE